LVGGAPPTTPHPHTPKPQSPIPNGNKWYGYNKKIIMKKCQKK